MKSFLVVAALILLASSATAGASVVVIDFETTPEGTALQNSSVDIGDYRIAQSGWTGSSDPDAEIFTNEFKSAQAQFSGNGTRRLVAFNRSTITVTAISGASFDFLGFDGAETWIDDGNSGEHQEARYIRASGARTGNAAPPHDHFKLDLNKDPLTGFQTFDTALFMNITQISLTGVCGFTAEGDDDTGSCNPEFSVDNLRVQSAVVPLPDSFVLCVSGLVGLGFTRAFKRG